MDIFKGLTLELVASGIVGLVMAGIVARGAIMGFIEARTKMREAEKAAAANPYTAIASAIWDKDQIERFLQLIENIGEVLELQAKHTEAIAKAQGILSDSFQQTTQSRLNDILERLDQAEAPKPRPRPRRKAKSTP